MEVMTSQAVMISVFLTSHPITHRHRTSTYVRWASLRDIVLALEETVSPSTIPPPLSAADGILKTWMGLGDTTRPSQEACYFGSFGLMPSA